MRRPSGSSPCTERSFGYLIDPHTAVGFSALDQYRAETGDETPIGGFHRQPLQVLRPRVGCPGDVRPGWPGPGRPGPAQPGHRRAGPAPLAALRSKQVRFRQTVEKEHMVDAVLEMLK